MSETEFVERIEELTKQVRVLAAMVAVERDREWALRERLDRLEAATDEPPQAMDLAASAPVEQSVDDQHHDRPAGQ